MVGLNANSRGEGEEGAGLHRLYIDLPVLLLPSFPLEPSPFPLPFPGREAPVGAPNGTQ